MTDYLIVEKIKNGEESAFEEIYRKYRCKVYNYIYYRIKFRSDVEDLLQETFMLVYKNINLFDSSKGTLYKFILANASRVIISYLRKKIKRKEKFESNLVNFVNTDDENPEEIFENYEEMEFLSKFISDLPENHKMAINLVYMRNMGYKEAARVMGKTESSFKSMLFRAKVELKENMMRQYPELGKRANFMRAMKICLITFMCVAMLSGLVYATIKICNDLFKKPSYTISEIIEEVPEEKVEISREEALEKISYYLDALGKSQEVSLDDLHLFMDYQSKIVSWKFQNDEFFINVDSANGNFVSFVNYTDNISPIDKNVDEISKALNLSDDYEFYCDDFIENARLIKYAKKYGDIYNPYQGVTYTVEGDKIKSIIVFDYSYEDKEVLVSKDEAMDILRENGIETVDIELCIEKINKNFEEEKGTEEVLTDVTYDNVGIHLIENTEFEVKKVWKAKLNSGLEYCVDVYTGELIYTGGINVIN